MSPDRIGAFKKSIKVTSAVTLFMATLAGVDSLAYKHSTDTDSKPTYQQTKTLQVKNNVGLLVIESIAFLAIPVMLATKQTEKNNNNS